MFGFILTIVVSLATLYEPEWLVLSTDGAGLRGLERPSQYYQLTENGGVKSDFDSLNVSLVGSWPVGLSYAVTHDSARNLVFVSSGRSVHILDVSNPANPQLVSDVIRTRGLVNHLYYANGKLYIACGESGLEIWDVNNYAFFALNPTKLGSYLVPAYEVYVSDSYACVANGNVLHIVDISNPQSPQEMGHCNMPAEVKDVYISGSYLYVADDDAGLRIVDITNPQSPREVGYYNIPNTFDCAMGVFVSDTFAYVIFNSSGLRVINVSNPKSPKEVGNLGIPILPWGIYVSGSYAYVRGFVPDPVVTVEELDIIDISNPQSPQEVGNYSWSWDRFFWVSDVCVFGFYAYVADVYCLRIIDVARPNSVVEVGCYHTAGCVLDVYVSGSYAYLAALDGFYVLDISNLQLPRRIGYYHIADGATSVFVTGSYAYVTSWNTLYILDVKNPQSPRRVGYINTPGDAHDVYVSGAYAYVACDTAGLRIIDISNPRSPREVGHCNTWGAFRVYVSGSYAYVAEGGAGLRIINVSNPRSPQEVGSYNVSENFGAGVLGVYVSGPYAYVACGGFGLRIVDVSNPQSPREVGYCITGYNTWSVFVSDSFAYVADVDCGLRIVNVARPDSPQEVGYYYHTPGCALNVFVSGYYAFVADVYAGFEIYRNLLLGAEGGNSHSNGVYVFFPCPLSSQFVVSKEGVYKVEVFDVSGRLVYRREGYFGEGTYSIPILKAGVYFVRVTQGSSFCGVKLVILK